MFYARRTWKSSRFGKKFLAGPTAWSASWHGRRAPALLDRRHPVEPAGRFQNVDALAIAPYLTFCVPERSTDLKALTAEGGLEMDGGSGPGLHEEKALPESVRLGSRSRRRWPTSTDLNLWPTRAASTWWA